MGLAHIYLQPIPPNPVTTLPAETLSGPNGIAIATLAIMGFILPFVLVFFAWIISKLLTDIREREKKLTNDNAQLQSVVGELSTKFAALRDEFDDAEEAHEEALKSKDEKISSLQKKLEDANHNIKTLQDQIAALQQEIADYRAIKEERDHLRVQLTESQTEGKILEQQLSRVRGENEALIQHQSQLEQRNAELNEYQKKLDSDLSQMTIKLQLMEREKARWEEERTSLQQRISELEAT